MIGMDKKPFHVLRLRKALDKPPPSSSSGGGPLQNNLSPVSRETTISATPTLASVPSATMSTPSANYYNLSSSSSQAPPMLPQTPPTNMLQHPTLTAHGTMSAGALPPHTPPGQPSRALLDALSANEARYSLQQAMVPQSNTNQPKPSLPPYLLPGSECRTFDDLVDEKTPIQKALGPSPFSPSIWDPNRRELIRKYSAIYGKNTGDRRQKDTLSEFEMQVNEAAFQLCLRDPTLLVRREELFTLSKRAVKEGGYVYYHGISKTKQSLNSVSSPVIGSHKHPRSTDGNPLEESGAPPAKMMLLKTALNIPTKLSVKRRLEHMQELESLITENKSQQAVKLAALESAQQNGDFSTAYSIQLDVESLGMTCEQLQTAYSTLKKRQYRSVRYFKNKKKEEEERDMSSASSAGGDELPVAVAGSGLATAPSSSYAISGTTDSTEGPVQLIDTSMLFSSPSVSQVRTTTLSSSSSPLKLNRNSPSKGGALSATSTSARSSPTVTATVIPSTSTQEQFDTRTHTVTVTIPSQEDASESAVRNLVENVSHATDEVNSLMMGWDNFQ